MVHTFSPIRALNPTKIPKNTEISKNGKVIWVRKMGYPMKGSFTKNKDLEKMSKMSF